MCFCDAPYREPGLEAGARPYEVSEKPYINNLNQSQSILMLLSTHAKVLGGTSDGNTLDNNFGEDA